MYLIDANIFLQVYLDQENFSASAELLNKLDSGDLEGKVTLFHLDAAAIIMENRGMKNEEIAEFYYRAYRCEGLEVVCLGVSGRLNALTRGSGLDDNLIHQAKKEFNIDEIVSYDTDFKDGKTPEKILEKGV